MNLLINISQIAIITGDNPYQSKRDYLIDFWKKYDKNDYETGLLNNLLKGLRLKPEVISTIKDRYNIK